jgi:hypothetical protein
LKVGQIRGTNYRRICPSSKKIKKSGTNSGTQNLSHFFLGTNAKFGKSAFFLGTNLESEQISTTKYFLL